MPQPEPSIDVSPGDLHDRELRKQAAYSGDPWTPNNPYFTHAEPFMANLWRHMIHPVIKDCDFHSVLDLGAGHGRNSVMLQPLCQHLGIMDIQAGNIDVCRQRFGVHDTVSYYTNNGYDMQPVGSASLTLVYTFDAMVHFDSDVVRSYLKDCFRVLVPGGRGFFHHSNYTGGSDWRANPASRNFMSQALFAHYAQKEGLKIVSQKVINWGKFEQLDCLSLIEK
jgi:SAM-dependent methyltransferase